MSKIFTQEEVNQHKKRGDLWLVVHGHVFDVSKFSEDHPGGDDIFLINAGKESGEEFENIKHGQEARDKGTSQYLIGKLANARATFPREGELLPKKLVEKPKTGLTNEGGDMSLMIGAGLIAAGAAAYFLYQRTKQ